MNYECYNNIFWKLCENFLHWLAKVLVSSRPRDSNLRLSCSQSRSRSHLWDQGEINLGLGLAGKTKVWKVSVLVSITWLIWPPVLVSVSCVKKYYRNTWGGMGVCLKKDTWFDHRKSLKYGTWVKFLKFKSCDYLIQTTDFSHIFSFIHLALYTLCSVWCAVDSAPL